MIFQMRHQIYFELIVWIRLHVFTEKQMEKNQNSVIIEFRKKYYHYDMVNLNLANRVYSFDSIKNTVLGPNRQY